jgi:membrane-associated phospholipid phosphatase
MTSSTTQHGVPGLAELGPWVARFDQRADAVLERLRGRRIPDTVFRAASHAGDFSAVWHVVAVGRAVAGGARGRRQAVVLMALLGAESLVVNQGVKRLFRRGRPTVAGDDRLRVRQPRTSSFPSGHASSAMFASSLLCRWDRGPWCALWRVMALVVATSRGYVRIHHASDVVGGALLGAVLARLVRPLVDATECIGRRHG